MVSIRRRKLLGLCSGTNATSVQNSASNDDAAITGSSGQNSMLNIVNQLTFSNFSEKKEEDALTTVSTSSKEYPQIQHLPVLEVKRRKKYRRKHVEDQEPCTMRGVYFKNMKWQAAIKVDKKQIHLGTCPSQEEAAHLYDRAAFMCGREPNFELPEEEKQELRQFKWEEFLAMTRNAINSKRHHRRFGSGAQRKGGTQSRGDWEPEKDTRTSSMSEDMEGDY